MDNLQVLKGLRILAVDDDADTLNLIQAIFEEYNVEIIPVASAREALKGITHLKPNFLISDICMPEEDGYSLIRKVRNLAQQLKKIPAIALTALPSEEQRTLAFDSGFSAYLVKPFDFNELIAIVSKLAFIALYDTCPVCGTENLSFIEWESSNKILFNCRSCHSNDIYDLDKAIKAGFMNQYH